MSKVRKIGYQVRRKPYQPLEFVPKLDLAGKWMIAAGFGIGQAVQVIVENGKITIQR